MNEKEEEESKKKEIPKETEKEIEGWTLIEQLEESTPSPVTSSSSTPAKQHHKWKKPRWAKKCKYYIVTPCVCVSFELYLRLLVNKAVKWRRKPRSRVKHYILE